jgi:hypothetical protein
LGIVSYYKHFPQGDDRYRKPLRRYGFDVDDVVCNWVDEWCKKFDQPLPSSWYFQWDLLDKFKEMNETGELAEFYLGLPAKEDAETWPVEPVCYISHRPIEDSVTKEWLKRNGFPLKPVYHVQNREDKLQIAIDQKLDFFVDDSYDTFRMFQDAGIACYLMDAKHNRKYNVGHWRIKSLKELPV